MLSRSLLMSPMVAGLLVLKEYGLEFASNRLIAFRNFSMSIKSCHPLSPPKFYHMAEKGASSKSAEVGARSRDSA